jgi:hypothetical protein
MFFLLLLQWVPLARSLIAEGAVVLGSGDSQPRLPWREDFEAQLSITFSSCVNPTQLKP